MNKLYGVITAMTTPFTDDDRVDVEALEQQTEFLIEKGVQCLYPTGSTGEMHLMNCEERELVAETVIRKAAGRVPVFIQAGAMTLKDTVRLAQHAERAGASGIGVVTPCYFGVDERTMIQYYKDVCGSVSKDFSVYAYVIPPFAHNNITAQTMEKICDVCPNLVGVKYSCAEMPQVLEYLCVRNGDFSVVLGTDHLFLPALVMGCDGVVSGCSDPMPEYFTQIYRLFQEGDIEAARQAQNKANELVWLMKFGADMSIFKNILSFRGVRGGHMRRPLTDLPQEDVSKLYEAVKPYL